MDITLETQRLVLRPFRKSYISGEYISWLNDKKLMQFSEQRFYDHTYESCLNYVNSFSDSQNILWAIFEKQHSVHVGNLTVYIDTNNGLADVGLLIGSRMHHGRGYGLEAWMRTLDFLLCDLCIRKVVGGAMACNVPMVSIMNRSGMTIDCIRRRHYVLDGNEVDLIFMAAFKSD